MANLPSNSSHLALHLSDRALIPLTSSSQSSSMNRRQSQAQAQALSSLTQVAITAYESTSRLGLGVPQRIMVETQSGGPVILHSYLSPQSQQPQSQHIGNETDRDIVAQTQEGFRPMTGTTDIESERLEGSQALVNGITGDVHDGREEADEAESTIQLPPLLIASVVAQSAADTGDARRAAARLERMGTEFQREWVREQEEAVLAVTPGEDD